jgi:hypothetical protein
MIVKARGLSMRGILKKSECLGAQHRIKRPRGFVKEIHDGIVHFTLCDLL